MKTAGIHKQLQELRKNKGKTQEELAEVFGVTNQAVSKWESGACYPDTALLPEIANYFGVSLDFLFGRVPEANDQNVVKDIKLLFEQTPAKERFTLACQIAFCLHEGIVSNGYKGYLPWDPDKTYDQRTWGTSICSEPEGVTIARQGMLFFSDHADKRELEPDQLLSLYGVLRAYADADRLTVLFGLYELTRHDFDCFVNMENIVGATGLDERIIRDAFLHLPVHCKRLEDSSIGYRIEASNMHLPALLMLFLPVRS
ncbi:helix-turn-helix domain-containing protein [Paenibacillus sp. FSL R7-0179]|uniref:helix-turn-helix domain-containing protein n=1 Tax=Paenibacillus sp. FSL R7-0179 TaxID=2921672 RepID=UPI0030FC7F05